MSGNRPRWRRVPPELDCLGVQTWLQDSLASTPPEHLDRNLTQETRAARREVLREAARRRRHALRLRQAPDAQAMAEELARREAEKQRAPWPDHWRSY